MKTCSSCGKELQTSLDEFGDMRSPICMSCFFDGKGEDASTEIEELEDEISECEEEIDGHESEISSLQGQIYECKEKIKYLKAKAGQKAVPGRG